MNTLDHVDARSLRDDIPEFRPGDTLKVHVRVIEGTRSRIQIFQGLVIRRQGAGLRETFTVRKVSFGTGVERTFPLHTPIIEKIEVVRHGVARRAQLYFLRKRIQQTKIYEKVSGILLGFVEGLQTIRKLDRPFLFVLHSINIWVMYFLMTYVCFFAFEPTAALSANVALVVFVFGGWGIVIPSPGGMGTYHFLATTALGFYGIAGDDGFSWSNISFFTIQIGCNITVGLLALILLPIINREKGEIPSTSDS